MVRLFSFTPQLSISRLLGSQPRVVENTFFDKMAAFKPKILSSIPPNSILEGHRWENYRNVGSAHGQSSLIHDHSTSRAREGAANRHNASSSSLEIDDLTMFNLRNDQPSDATLYLRPRSSSSNTSSSLSSLSSIEGQNNTEFIGNPARVMPPPYPYPEEPPPTYEEAMLSQNPNMDVAAAEEVAMTLAELDSVLSEYHSDAPVRFRDVTDPMRWVQSRLWLTQQQQQNGLSQIQEDHNSSEHSWSGSNYEETAQIEQSDNFLPRSETNFTDIYHQNARNEQSEIYHLSAQTALNNTRGQNSYLREYAVTPAVRSEQRTGQRYPDLWAGNGPVLTRVDRIPRVVQTFDQSLRFQEDFRASYQLSHSRDMLY